MQHRFSLADTAGGILLTIYIQQLTLVYYGNFPLAVQQFLGVWVHNLFTCNYFPIKIIHQFYTKTSNQYISVEFFFCYFLLVTQKYWLDTVLYKECQVLPALSLILRTACSSLNCKIQKLIKMLKYSKNLELSATSTYNIKKNHREVTFLSFSCMSIFPCTLSQSVVSEKGHTVPDCPSICLFFFFSPFK